MSADRRTTIVLELREGAAQLHERLDGTPDMQLEPPIDTFETARRRLSIGFGLFNGQRRLIFATYRRRAIDESWEIMRNGTFAMSMSQLSRLGETIAKALEQAAREDRTRT